MAIIIRFSSFLLLLLLATFTTSIVAQTSVGSARKVDGAKICLYSLYVKTGDVEKAGTDSKISMNFTDYTGKTLVVENVRSIGLMGADHDYFEKGQVDVFGVGTQCLITPICSVSILSDGKGIYPAWYLETIQISFAGIGRECYETIFSINEWLSSSGSLSYVVNNCWFRPFPFLGSNNVEGQELVAEKIMEVAQPSFVAAAADELKPLTVNDI